MLEDAHTVIQEFWSINNTEKGAGQNNSFIQMVQEDLPKLLSLYWRH